MNRIEEYHCCYCRCPVSKWEPLDSYKNDDSFKFFSDVYDIAETLESRCGAVNREKLLAVCKLLVNKYKDIPDFKAAIYECFDIFEDMSVFATELPV